MARGRRYSDKGIKIGEIAFLAGIFLAIIAGIAADYISDTNLVIGILYLLGLVVGLLNIQKKEFTGFLVAAIALVIGASISFAGYGAIGASVDRILDYMAAFVIPAMIIVSLKAVWELAGD
ncbi:MAG: hypothetical protein J7K83_02225 [Candidatus Aenigmarchaeota archaeon]|nr:hypothetical protein [Candidatus Aenigmarchaeota archaeon]